MGIHIGKIDDIDNINSNTYKHINIIQIFVSATTNYNDDKYLNILKVLQKRKIKLVVHGSYSINLAHRWTETSWQIQQFINEIKASNDLNAFGIVIHTGKQLELNLAEAINNMYTSLLYIHNKTKEYQNVKIIIETPSGQGTETLTHIDDFCIFMNKFYLHPDINIRNRFGICVDTCHIFAAGYDIRNDKDTGNFFKTIHNMVGIDKIKLCQLNDSKKGLGEFKDRHENLGDGHIGKNGLSKVIKFMKELKIPIILETPEKKIDDDYIYLTSIS
jgi:deoxyribonuclease-4